MTPELGRLLDRMRQRREQRAAELADPARSAGVADVARGLVHPIGTRVFDPVTGQEGIVIDGSVENVDRDDRR
jgi:hypothetical protein